MELVESHLPAITANIARPLPLFFLSFVDLFENYRPPILRTLRERTRRSYKTLTGSGDARMRVKKEQSPLKQRWTAKKQEKKGIRGVRSKACSRQCFIGAASTASMYLRGRKPVSRVEKR